ncbi:hypothetical protein HJG60_009129 [Phyllostomus discolor]|uniref:Uncharacterized protein n=1 Tax=Phyllostomus discolor TaxID=89673 RepID=A0A833YSB4_9CHIR|nr:hypothetical protein HJG60_009129 [Phyllostomus discolor]
MRSPVWNQDAGLHGPRVPLPPEHAHAKSPVPSHLATRSPQTLSWSFSGFKHKTLYRTQCMSEMVASEVSDAGTMAGHLRTNKVECTPHPTAASGTGLRVTSGSEPSPHFRTTEVGPSKRPTISLKGGRHPTQGQCSFQPDFAPRGLNSFCF